MSVISITITPSATEVLPGIPSQITISANIPSIIFYTLDGSTPTTGSPIYTSSILMPQLVDITLSIFATNGIDSSAIIVEQYTANTSEIETMAGDRLPHAAVEKTGCPPNNVSLYPFGGSGQSDGSIYLNPADAGTTVYTETKSPVYSSGVDANGNPVELSNQPPAYYQNNQVYSTTTSQGEIFPGVGNLPATTTVIGSPYQVEYRQEYSSTADKIFNPRALVIYQDAATEDPTNPMIVNKPYFSLESPEIVRDGNLLYNNGLDAPPTMGSFVNRYYNPRTNTITNYYYDNTVQRWIISSAPYQPTSQGLGDLSGMVFGRETGPGKVFLWIWGKYHTLT